MSRERVDRGAAKIGPILRDTKAGGALKLSEYSSTPTCGTCDNPRPIGLTYATSEAIKLDTGICADCLAEALGILWGRRHVQQGGHVHELIFGTVELREVSQ